MASILKAGALIFKGKKLLIVRPKGKTFWINAGGKYELGESAEECLRRELQEELQVEVKSVSHFKTYRQEKAAEDNPHPLILELHIVEVEGQPQPSSEIEEIAWLDMKSFNSKKFKLNQSFNDVVPDLRKRGLL